MPCAPDRNRTPDSCGLGSASPRRSKCGTTRQRSAILERMARRQRAQGALSPLRLTLLALGATLIAAGRLADAEACYDEAVELTVAVGQDPAVFNRMNGELLAWQGKSEEARANVRHRDREARSQPDSMSTSTAACRRSPHSS